MEKTWYFKNKEQKIEKKRRREEDFKRDLPRTPFTILLNALKTKLRIEDKYGKENLNSFDENEITLLFGRLEALQWFMGNEWNEIFV